MAVLNEVLTASFEVEDKVSKTYPGAGVRAGVQSTALKLLVHLWKLASLFAEGELGMTANPSVV